MGNCLKKQNRVKKLKGQNNDNHLRVIEVEKNQPPQPFHKMAVPVEICELRKKRTTPKIQGRQLVVRVDVHRAFDDQEDRTVAVVAHAENKKEEIFAKGDSGCEKEIDQLLAAKPEVPEVVEDINRPPIPALVEKPEHQRTKQTDFFSVTTLLDEVFKRNKLLPYTVAFTTNGKGPKMWIVQLDQNLLHKIQNLPEIQRGPAN